MSPDELKHELECLHPAAFGWALACCAGDRVAAEDALQTSYLKILDGRARFDGRASFRTWVFAVVRRTAAEEWRRAPLRWLLPLRALHGAAATRTDPGTAPVRSQTTRRRGRGSPWAARSRPASGRARGLRRSISVASTSPHRQASGSGRRAPTCCAVRARSAASICPTPDSGPPP